MKDTINKLKPIERLYLISKEKEGIFTKKNRLYCLIYALLENHNLKLSNTSNKFKIQYGGTQTNKDYENTFISLIKEKKFIDLNNFINNLEVFNQTLVDNGILKLEVKAKKFLFLKLAKNEITKTSIYYGIQAVYNKNVEDGIPIMDAVCENLEYKDKIFNFYNLLKQKMHQAVLDEQKKKDDTNKKKNTKSN